MGKFVQSKNPKTGLYVKINKEDGTIAAHKKTPGAFKGIAFARKKKVFTSEEAKIQIDKLTKEIEKLEIKIRQLAVACKLKD